MKESLIRLLLWLLSLQGNPSLLPWCFDQLQRLFKGEPERYLRFLKTFVSHDSWFYRFLAAHQLGSLYPFFPDETVHLLKRLSRDENDLVLEAAAHGWSEALKEDFDPVFRELVQLKKTGDYTERRTAALAPVEYYREGAISKAKENRIERFWISYQDDPRSGLRNLVQQRIIDRTVTDDE